MEQKELASLRQLLGRWDLLLSEVNELAELGQLAEAEEDESLSQEIAQRTNKLAQEIAQREFDLLLSGDYDARDAILAIHAGTGGVDAMDWAQMLLRMYLRYAEQRGYRADILDESKGEEAGLKSVTVEIKGDYAYGYLKSEHGVHRLVRQSPFNADQLRQTSFALVEVLPVLGQHDEISIAPEELKMEMFRAGGAGGQNVNKTSTAVRLTHIPTGLVAASQTERSQVQNRANALKILRAQLVLRRQKEREAEKRKLRGSYQSAEWGNQIRSYVLHPYQLVKDHRTKVETSNTQGILDGSLQPFIEGYLNWRATCEINQKP